MGQIFSVRLVCEECGFAYLLQLGQIHELDLRTRIERQIVRCQEDHEHRCKSLAPTPRGNGSRPLERITADAKKPAP